MTKGLKKIDLANAMGVDAGLVSRYVQRGMPTHSVAAALEWKAKNIRPRVKVAGNEQIGIFDYDNARAKREHFAALLAETQARKEMGELVELSEVVRTFSQVGTTLRVSLEGFAATLSPRLVGHDEAGIRAILASEVERVLQNMSDTMQAKADAAGQSTERGANG